jgi:hypothetical protein
VCCCYLSVNVPPIHTPALQFKEIEPNRASSCSPCAFCVSTT